MGLRYKCDVASAFVRGAAEAERLVRAAERTLPTDPREAECLLGAALGADRFHGPTHHNLGVLLLHQGQLYEAAQEFGWREWALARLGTRGE